MASAQNAVWTQPGKPSCTKNRKKKKKKASEYRQKTFSYTGFAEFDATGFDMYDDELIPTPFKATFQLHYKARVLGVKEMQLSLLV